MLPVSGYCFLKSRMLWLRTDQSVTFYISCSSFFVLQDKLLCGQPGFLLPILRNLVITSWKTLTIIKWPMFLKFTYSQGDFIYPGKRLESIEKMILRLVRHDSTIILSSLPIQGAGMFKAARDCLSSRRYEKH